jgi:hypothetical protein
MVVVTRTREAVVKEAGRIPAAVVEVMEAL